MYDINTEHFGWNREEGETTLGYINRVWEDDFLSTVDNNAFADMRFERAMEINDICKPIEG